MKDALIDFDTVDQPTDDMLPMIVDSFAGGGGASTGIELALGRSPDVAINHNAQALALHEANHPETLHLDSNIWDVDPVEVCAGRKVGLLWASPDCKHFSKAKGGAPKDRNIRDLAWIIVRWARFVKPDVILMENVEEFRTWGPVGEDGQPIKELAGLTFDDWVTALREAGYKIEWRELRACDYGAPTIRKRFFMVARRDGRKIVWPKPTHGDPNSDAVKAGKLKPYRTAAECIDWSIPCPSIFDTGAEIKAKLGLTAKRPLAPNTLARVARGMKRYVLDAQSPYLVNLTHGGRVEAATDPFRTITGARRGEKAVVSPYVTRFNSGATGSPIGDPLPTVTANSYVKRPGGAAPLGLIAPSLVSVAHGYSGGRREYPATIPMGTVTSGGIANAIVAPSLMSLKGTARRSSAITSPHPTVLAGGGHSAVIAPVLTYAQHGGQVRDILDPVHTITASKKDNNSLIIPTLVGCGGRAGQSRPRAGDEPMATVTAKADGCLATAFLAQHNKARQGFNPGRPVDAPISTLTGSGSQQSAVAAFFAKYYGTGDGARMDEPCHTVTVRDRFSHVQAELSAPSFGPEHEAKARQVAEFLRKYDAWDGGEYVTLTVGGETFVVVDIGMRMLTPRELFNAQGFPPDYVIEGVWKQDGDDWTFAPFTKNVQVSCCGNSVCPDLAEALAAANCRHLMTKEKLMELDKGDRMTAKAS
ncbi:DNA cytosine methyltransferase [Thalassovita aquimarina]|uniref:DNA (cytosine-5-)-methyltransferase n=1 Tax=Thalassovita aquimarina TaxID=2785917 RepID=A0ABS5HSE0_9RHOB|nr:DNA cytosine methyltransferase [Thalassovita aquimarina]MBR9651882.1 DNA cytosine methyltransferase [Thalassovita aquimarina]